VSIRFAIGIYNGMLATLTLLGLPVWLVWWLRSPRVRAMFRERLRPLQDSQEGTLWIHAASVGEVEAVAPLIRRLRERQVPLRLTALSDTGRARLVELFPDCGPRLAPLDLPWLVHASVRAARVRALVLVETELWPNWIAAMRRAGGVILLASARLSDRSFPRYRRLRWLVGPVIAQLTAIAARGPTDRERFIDLGAAPERVRVVGDLKWARHLGLRPSDALRAAIGPGPFLLGASTHPGEERALLEAYRFLRREIPGLRLLIAPRHVDRCDSLVAELEASEFAVGRRSRGAPEAPVVLLDTMGELASLYDLASLVFSGGSLVPVGGHSLVEIVQGGRVAVVGPHTHNQRPQIELLEPTGALIRVERAEQLGDALLRLWRDPDRDAPARAAWSVCQHESRALDRVVAWLEELEVAPSLGGVELRKRVDEERGRGPILADSKQ